MRDLQRRGCRLSAPSLDADREPAADDWRRLEVGLRRVGSVPSQIGNADVKAGLTATAVGLLVGGIAASPDALRVTFAGATAGHGVAQTLLALTVVGLVAAPVSVGAGQGIPLRPASVEGEAAAAGLSGIPWPAPTALGGSFQALPSRAAIRRSRLAGERQRLLWQTPVRSLRTTHRISGHERKNMAKATTEETAQKLVDLALETRRAGGPTAETLERLMTIAEEQMGLR